MNLDELRSVVNGAGITGDDLGQDVKGGPLAQAWNFRTLEHAYAPRDPLLYLVEGFLAAPSLNIVYGPPGAMKSMLLADLAMCVSLGIPFLEPSPDPNVKPGVTMKTTQAKVLWIDLDNGIRRSDVRFGALGKAHGAPKENPNLLYVPMPDPRFDASNTRMMNDFKRIIAELDYKLIVIDNLGLAIGEADENKSEMTTVMNNFKYIVEELGVCIVIIHHPSKGGIAEGATLGDKLRGHGAIAAALDASFYVQRARSSDELIVIPTKVREYNLQQFGAKFAYDHVPGTFDLDSARYWSLTAASPEELARSNVQEAILRVMVEAAGEQVTATSLRDDVRATMAGPMEVAVASNNTINGQAVIMAKEGLLDISKEGRSKVYTLTENGWQRAMEMGVQP